MAAGDADDSEQQEEEEVRVYWYRWLVLVGLSGLSFVQCLNWITFSPIAGPTEDYYDIDAATVDLLLNWGPIIFIPVVPIVSKMMLRDDGLQLTVRVGATLCVVGALLRCVPSIAGAPKARGAVAAVHIGQILNAATGPCVMAPPPRMSLEWFAEHERARATSIAVLSNNFGAAVGFLVALLVSDQGDVHTLLYVEAAFAALFCVPLALLFPARPPLPPSREAAAERARLAGRAPNETGKDASSQSATLLDDLPGFVAELRGLAGNRSFLALAVSGGAVGGVFNGWSGALDTILGASGSGSGSGAPDDLGSSGSGVFTQAQVGWFGFGCTITYILGGLLSGVLGDTLLRQRFKLLITASYFFSFLTFIAFMLLLPSPFRDVEEPSFFGVLLLLITATFFLGATQPVMYELAAEITHPVQEGTSAGGISFFNNVGCVIFLFVSPIIPSEWQNVIMTLTVALCFALTMSVEERYRRTGDTAGRGGGSAGLNDG